MATVGFKSAIIAPLDKNEKVDPSKIYIFSETGGGAIEGAVTGLAPTQNTVYASNVPFYVSSKGTGNVQLALTVGDKEGLPADSIGNILGWAKDEETGIYVVGKDSEAPYCAVILITEDAQGNELYIGLLKGRFSFDGDDIVTTDDNGATLSADVLNGTFVSRKLDGNVYAKGRETDDVTQEIFQAFVFPVSDDSGGDNNGGGSGTEKIQVSSSPSKKAKEQATV